MKDKTVKSLERTSTHTIYKTGDGKRVPGGSTLAKVVAFGDPTGLMKWAVRCHEEGKDFLAVRNESGELGTIFHKVVECRFTGERLPVEQYPPVFLGQAERMADSFYAELARLDLNILASEVIHTSDFLRCGGQIDLVLAHKSEPTYPAVLGDLKSSNYLGGEHCLQVAGIYRELFAEKYGHYPESVILFRADRDSGTCRGVTIPSDVVQAAAQAVPLVRELYDIRKVLERRLQ